MRAYALLDGVGSVGDGPVKDLEVKGIRGMYGLVQVKISGTVTVKIYGRFDSNYDWKEIVTITASDAVEIVLFPQMKARYDSGTGQAWVGLIGA